ncbi:membrane protein [Sphaerisporangium melleum]|uniref:Membrane protein n=1 Tax=Sphaerisporangium melleum TaxID=321316 RepID=A0A917VHM6_9ACTN|nr:YfhO family protein [Sphaerisporangium melleum]GGK78418.1 membrane protein [Sphaerisporangium melleum]GII69816.1 membrane protein [Sphaerisporangium melleum]
MTTQELQPPAGESSHPHGDAVPVDVLGHVLAGRVRPGARAVRARAGAAIMAALLAVAGLTAGDAIAGFFPFGGISRSVSDLGNQYVPFYAYYWDVLHGRARGDLFVNWASGLGSSYLPDLFYYLASPFSLLVALFPREQVDLAVYVVTVAKIATAAGVMAWYLRRISSRPLRFGSGVAAVFGAAYGLCGWAVTDAVYNPMWLDGLIAFPLLCLVVEWALTERLAVLGVASVAFVWICDFYTAYFATLGAAVVLLVRLVAEPASLPARLRGCARAALYAAFGMGTAAPVVLVVYAAAKDAWPVAPRPFVPPEAGTLLGRLLPGGYQFSSPALFVGTFALFAALTLPFNRAVPLRARAAWTAAIGLVLASMLWQPAVRFWYAFTNPNGSFYREAFVLCGLLVVAGWTSLSRGLPRPPALAGAAALLAGVVWTASGWEQTTPRMIERVAAVAVAGAVLYGMLVLARRRGERVRRGVALAALAGLAAVQTVEAAANVASVDVKRAVHLDEHAAWGPWHAKLRTAVAAADGWPAYRTDPGRAQVSANAPQLVGGEGAQYYSSMTSAVLIDTLHRLGFGWASRGRAPASLDNPVTDAALGIAARAHSVPAPPLTDRGAAPSWPAEVWRTLSQAMTRVRPGPLATTGTPSPMTVAEGTARPTRTIGASPRDAAVTLVRRPAAPLVTVRPPSHPVPAYGASPFHNQELLLGSPVYDVPDVRYLAHDRTELPPDAQGALAMTPDLVPSRSYPYVLRATCRPGLEVYLNAPELAGVATLAGNEPVPFGGVAGQRRAPVQRLGVVPKTGRLKVKLRPSLPGSVPRQAIGCLDPARLAKAVHRLRDTGATKVRVSGHTLSATLPPGSTGTAIVAVPAIRGWTCALGPGRHRPLRHHLGLLAVPLDGTSTTLTCTFTPPGLRTGLHVAAASLVLAVATLLITRLRRRRIRPGRRSDRLHQATSHHRSH